MFALSCRREDLIREPERPLGLRESVIYTKAVALRQQRRPLAYITGEGWFYGHPFKINRAVLIPRPETEMLVDFAVEKAATLSLSPLIADIGTGSGCIAVSIALKLPAARIFAVDISPLALNVARKNVRRHAVDAQVTVVEGDLLSPLSGTKLDLILSNPPYIAAADVPGLMPEVGIYEPSLALYDGAGEDGTQVHRRLYREARAILRPGGWLAMEAGFGQAATLCSVAAQCGYKSVEIRQDFSGIARVVVAQWIV
jgi:release factor glutamine methyltransferase